MSNITVVSRKSNIATVKYERLTVAGLEIPFTIPGIIGNAMVGETASITLTNRRKNITVS
jgi:hypothetical protein